MVLGIVCGVGDAVVVFLQMIVDKFAWGLDVRFAFLHFLSFILFVQQRVSSLHFDGTCFVS